VNIVLLSEVQEFRVARQATVQPTTGVPLEEIKLRHHLETSLRVGGGGGKDWVHLIWSRGWVHLQQERRHLWLGAKLCVELVWPTEFGLGVLLPLSPADL